MLLRALVRRRWAIPVLAHLLREEGDRFIPMAHALGASPPVLREALAHLIAEGLVMPNPGHGHPLRPEYVLTPAGERAAPTCGRVDQLLARLDLREVGLRRWTLPALLAVRQGAHRFGDIAGVLSPVTDRALSQALVTLTGASLLERRLVDSRPPHAEYRSTPLGLRIVRAVEPLALN